MFAARLFSYSMSNRHSTSSLRNEHWSDCRRFACSRRFIVIGTVGGTRKKRGASDLDPVSRGKRDLCSPAIASRRRAHAANPDDRPSVNVPKARTFKMRASNYPRMLTRTIVKPEKRRKRSTGAR